VSTDNGAANYAAGLEAYNAGDNATAISKWSTAALSGSSAAAYNLGVLLEGQGNTADAITWLVKASELGDPDASLNVAQMYGDLEEDAEALKWYLAAAESGNAEAYSGAGHACANAGDTAAARGWWLKAADEGDAVAMCNLGVLDKAVDDYGSAREWFEKSSALGYSEADENLELLDAIEYEDEGTTEYPSYEVILTAMLSALSDSGDLLEVGTRIEEFQERVQELVHGDEPSPESGNRSEFAKRIDYLARQQEPAINRVMLRAMILLIPWPAYDKGDGYWSAPSTAAVNIATDARGLSLEETEWINALEESLGDSIGLIDLGVVSNPSMPHSALLHAANRKSPETGTPRPPVMVVAAAHKNLYSDESAALVGALSDEDGLNWVSHLIGQADGWMWPDWQYAFGEISPLVERSPAFWSAVLKTQPGSRCALAEFEEEQGIDPEFYEDCLNDLTGYVAESPKMRALVEASGWEPGLSLLEE
jgi:tetratricopeptide (TPR) repeat protein